jgi:hypothetical protein
MGQVLGDLVALGRCRRLARGFPAALMAGSRMISGLSNAYDDAVAPFVDSAIDDQAKRAEVGFALRAMSAKIGMVVMFYGRLLGCVPPMEIAALAGAVTRLYDDLIDGSADTSLDDRLSDLFNDRAFSPRGELEHLLDNLVTAIRRRVRQEPGGTLDVAINALHEYQCLSRRQREDSVPFAVLDKICRGKGAMANLVLCGLVKPHLDADERELFMALGETLQSLDDYQDVELDRRAGVATLASLGATTLTGIASRLCVIHGQIVAQYGRRAARPYGGMIFFLLLKAFLGRRLPILGQVIRKLASRSPTLVFLTRGTEALPAMDRHGRRA